MEQFKADQQMKGIKISKLSLPLYLSYTSRIYFWLSLLSSVVLFPTSNPQFIQFLLPVQGYRNHLYYHLLSRPFDGFPRITTDLVSIIQPLIHLTSSLPMADMKEHKGSTALPLPKPKAPKPKQTATSGGSQGGGAGAGDRQEEMVSSLSLSLSHSFPHAFPAFLPYTR